MGWLLPAAVVVALVAQSASFDWIITSLGGGLTPERIAYEGTTVRMEMQFPTPLQDGFAAVHRNGLAGPYYAGVFISNDSYLGSPLGALSSQTDATYEDGFMTFLIRDVRNSDEGMYYCVFEPGDFNGIYWFTLCGQRLTVITFQERLTMWYRALLMANYNSTDYVRPNSTTVPTNASLV